jgi:iron(III) transport system substrate-binding protein
MKRISGLLGVFLSIAAAPAMNAYGADTSQATPQVQVSQAGNEDWKKEWDKVVAAANKEGSLVVAGPPQGAERSVILTFQKAYPQIRMQYTGLVASAFLSRMVTERSGGLYNWDIFIGGVSSGYKYISQGHFQPVKPNLRPDIADDSIWLGGFNAGFKDEAGQYMYGFTQYITNLIKINRSVVPESQLNSAEGLLDPKWKGKITMYDPRAGGAGTLAVTMLYKELGDKALKTLLVDQNPVLSTDKRQFTEWVVRGRYPIGIGIVDPYLAPFLEQGIGKDVGNLSTKIEVVTTGSGNLHILANNPNPNATKVFANWLLSRETQEVWAKTAATNSRRKDVTPGSPETQPALEKIENYEDFNAERGNKLMQETRTISQKLIP